MYGSKTREQDSVSPRFCSDPEIRILTQRLHFQFCPKWLGKWPDRIVMIFNWLSRFWSWIKNIRTFAPSAQNSCTRNEMWMREKKGQTTVKDELQGTNVRIGQESKRMGWEKTRRLATMMNDCDGNMKRRVFPCVCLPLVRKQLQKHWSVFSMASSFLLETDCDVCRIWSFLALRCK